MRRRILGDKTLKGTIVADGSYTVGNVVLYDKAERKKIVIDINSPSQAFPFSAYTPIGVIVIPQSHNVYGNNQAAAMSLVEMDYNTPDVGSTSYQDICWGGKGTDISSLIDYNVCNKVDTTTGLVNGTYDSPLLPSDKFSGGDCILDTNVKYKYVSGHSVYINMSAPSAYLTDGSRNNDYSSTSQSLGNALSDFKGIKNTQILCDLSTAQSDWKTSMGHYTFPEVTGTISTSEGITINWSTQSGEWNESVDDSAYDSKKFTCTSPGNNGSTVLRCTFSGNVGDKIVFDGYSDGESTYDYLNIGLLDQACNRNSSTTVSTKGKQKQHLYAMFRLNDTNEHYVEFCYSKDSSVHNGADNAEVKIIKQPVPATTPIINSYDANYYPAACCCWRFHTDGTSQGDWYLPAMGELGYLMPRWNVIQTSLQAIIDAGGEELCCLLLNVYGYWSSSEYSSTGARSLNTIDGATEYFTKNTIAHYVRAFLRVGSVASSTDS